MNIFSYESKVSQVLMFVADLAILNLCFILCCIPVFTIGAAQAALYTGVRILVDPENDESPVKHFFKAFVTGFKTITLSWGAAALGVLFTGVTMYLVSLLGMNMNGTKVPFWMSVVAFGVFVLWSSQIPLFHSRFTCSVKQLWRNSMILLILHPLRSVLAAALIWGPVAIIVFDKTGQIAMRSSIAFFLLYYAVTFMVNFYIMKKPFNKFIQEANGETGETGETEETEETEEIEN